MPSSDGWFKKNPNNTTIHRQCGGCKEIKELSLDNFYADRSAIGGFEFRCKVCVNKKNKSNYIKHSELSEEDRKEKNDKAREYYYRPEKKAKTRLNSYKGNDRKKGMICTLTEDYLEGLLSKPCNYCGFPSTGADRIDNSIPHTNENCIPCCEECNRARSDKFSVEEMKLIGATIRIVKLSRILKQ